MASTFRNVIDFFDELGIYDVVLPFLLVFTIVFAIFEKTRILGTEEIEGKHYTKKNLNSMVAFVIAFLVVASAKLVETINEAMANIVILIFTSVSFLLLIGTFFSEGEEVFLKEGPWRTAGMLVMGAGVTLIFLAALGWLEIIWDFLAEHWNTEAVASIILLIVIIGFMVYATSDRSPPKHARDD